MNRRNLAQQTIFDDHLIWVIRKELNHPDLLEGQFATVGLGIKFTYGNLIKIHFWLGLIIMSNFFEFSDNVLSGSAFTDPFGVFQPQI